MATKFRSYLALTTSLWILGIGAASAQTTSSGQAPAAINLGSVTATGSTGGYVVPSGTGSRAQAVAAQKLAPNIVYAQPNSVIRKLPDANGAEAFRRIPGIAMQSDSGFGRFLVIRGLAEDLNATQYAGIDLPAVNTNANPGGGGRGVSLDFIPPGLIGGAEVIATLTPDIAATGLGGIAAILPPALPVNGNSVLNVTAATGYTPAQGHALFQGSLTGGGHFAIPGMAATQNNKPFSFIGSFGYFNASPGIFDVEEGYTNPTTAGQPAELNVLQLRRYNNNRITQGYSGEVDFDPNNAVHLYLRGMYSYDNESILKNELYLQNLDGSAGGAATATGDNAYSATGANLTKYFANSAERVGMTFLEGGGRFTIANLVTLNLHSAYVEGFDNFTRDFTSHFNSNFNSNNQNLNITYNTSNPALRTYRITDASGAAYNPADPNNYGFGDLTSTPSHTTDKIYDNGFDAALPTSFLNTLGTFEAGGDISLRSRGALQDQASLTPANPFSLATVVAGRNTQFDYGNAYAVGPDLNWGQALGLPYAATINTLSNTLAFQHDSENIYAGFAQEDLQFGNAEALAGARVEATDDSYTAYGSTTDASGNQSVNATPTTRNESYTNFFPTVQMKYAFTDALQGRFSYSTGIGRPGFQQVNPAISTTIAGGQGGRNLVSQGNPNLKPMTGNSFDLALEYYMPHGGLLEADGFQKDFANYVISTNINTPTTTLETFQNVNGAVARGVVLEALQNLYFLPAPLDGLGMEANLTCVDATADVIQGQGRSILPQTYPLTINGTESYKNGPFELDVAETYNSRNLFQVGSNPGTNVYTQPVFQLDISAFYNVTPKWQVFFEGNNLTDYKLEFTQSAASFYPIQREYYGQKFILGVHYSLGS